MHSWFELMNTQNSYIEEALVEKLDILTKFIEINNYMRCIKIQHFMMKPFSVLACGIVFNVQHTNLDGIDFMLYICFLYQSLGQVQF